MEKHSPSYIQTNHSSEDRDGENYRYFSIKFVKEIEYDDSSSSQEDLDHECREKVRRDWSLKDGSDVKDQQSKKNEEELEVKQLAAIPDTGVTNLIEAWRQQTSHFQTMVEKNDELLEMNLHLMQEMSTIKTSNVHLQEELADVRQYVENMKRDLKQMVPTSTHLSKKYQDLAVSTSDHATCSTASTSSYETTSTSTPTTPWFTVKDPKDDDNLQKNSDIICETPKTSTSGTCTETDKERSCTAISVQKTEKQNYLNSESSHSILMRKFSNDQSSSRTSFVSAVNFDNVILNAHAESNLPSGENTAVNGGQTNPDYRLTRNQFSNDHSNRTEDFTNAFWPIGDQDETPTAEIEDVLIRSSSSSKSSSLLQSSGSHDGSLSKRESWNQITGNRSVTFLDNVTSTSKMENVPEERSKNEDVLIRSSSSLKSSSLLQSSGSHDGSLSKRESWNQITGNRSVTFLDNVTSTSKMENVPEERSNSLMHSFSRGLLERTEDLSGTIQNITAASMSSSKEICVKDSIEEISSLSKQEDKFPFHDALISSDDAHHQSETPSGASGLLNERNDYVDKDLNFDEKSSFVSVKALIQKICSDINKERVGSLAKVKAKAEENVIQHDSSIVETGLALPLSKKYVPVAQCSNTMNLAPSCLPTVGPYASVLPNKGQTTSNDLGIPNNSLQRLNTTASGKSKMPKTVSERHDIAEIPFRKADTSLRKMSLTPKAYKTEHLAHAACVQNTSSKNGNIVVENVGPMIVLTDYDKEQLMISSNISLAGRQQNMHSRETVSERHDIAEIPFRKPAADLRKTSLTPKADKTEHLAHGTCVQNTSSKNGIIVVENVGPMIVVRDCDKEQLTMISSNISVAGKQQNLHSRDKTASLTSQDDNLTCQKTADKDQNRETDIDKILIENVGPIITKPHPSAYTRAQVSKEESSSRILSSVAQKTLFINEKSGLEEFPEKRAVRASQSPAAKKGKICKEILDKTASTRKNCPNSSQRAKSKFHIRGCSIDS
ncbi:uncharacterized protein LOC112555329 isoform X3 [Pomacea canaliculata]|uniref:uncharacterized protein LOC112555329 isoform X3 n=1 Tax=Pomacea canaliculata TaxID=400727 RepID=UPI000D73B14E|nr:uncharacterized protein LOC112555329 isoform X3 [Pomacea canaliculata]